MSLVVLLVVSVMDTGIQTRVWVIMGQNSLEIVSLFAHHGGAIWQSPLHGPSGPVQTEASASFSTTKAELYSGFQKVSV
jgi:hypothetical protein